MFVFVPLLRLSLFFSSLFPSSPQFYPSSTTIDTQRWFEYFNGNYLFICCFRLFSFLVIFFFSPRDQTFMSVTKYSDTLSKRTLKVIYVFRRQAGYENKHHILHRGMKKADSFEISTSLVPSHAPRDFSFLLVPFPWVTIKRGEGIGETGRVTPLWVILKVPTEALWRRRWKK